MTTTQVTIIGVPIDGQRSDDWAIRFEDGTLYGQTYSHRDEAEFRCQVEGWQIDRLTVKED